jgi:type II secretory pathway component GspD/PulD (secretin)
VDKYTFYSGLKSAGVTVANTNTPAMISKVVRDFFATLGVNMDPSLGKVIFYNDSNGMLFVKATQADQDMIGHALQTLNQAAPQVHIKVRFLEVPAGQGMDVYLGQIQKTKSGATTSGAFPGAMATSLVKPPALSGGSLPAAGGVNAAQISGILTDPDFRTILQTVKSTKGVVNLGEPEVTTMSGRQCQVRATQSISVVSNFVYQAGRTNGPDAVVPQIMQYEAGPAVDVVPYVLADGYTINLAVIPTVTEFLGYDNPPAIPNVTGTNNRVQLPVVLPRFSKRQMVATINLRDNQTAILAGMSEVNSHTHKVPVLGSVPLMGKLFQSENSTTNEILVFVTATIVDPAGNRVHSDRELSNLPISAAPDIVPVR